jgi:hypothetical protein
VTGRAGRTATALPHEPVLAALSSASGPRGAS